MDTTLNRLGWYGLMLILVTMMMGSGRGDIKECPEYCRCRMRDGLRHMNCIDKGIINLEIGGPRRLEWLTLSHNKISHIYNHLLEDLGYEKLVILELDHNVLTVVDMYAFAKLYKLEKLDLSHNYLRHLHPSTFEFNRSLKVLNLSNNPVKILSETVFLASPSLQVLDLSECRLPHLHWTTFGLLPSMRELNLSKNAMVTIHRNLFTSAKSLKSVDVSGNPLICDSHIYEVGKTLAGKSVQLVGSPCKEEQEQEEETKNNMMEKMIELPTLQELDDEELKEEEKYLEEEDVKENEEMKCGCDRIVKEEVDVKKVNGCPNSRINLPMVLVLALLAGIAVGVFLSACFVMARLSVDAGKRRARRRRRHDNTFWSYEFREPTDDGTPPPAYNQLAFTFDDGHPLQNLQTVQR